MNPQPMPSGQRPGWFYRHPLPAFIVVGALLLGVDALLTRNDAVIRVPAAQQQAGAQVAARWIEEEVLYREAMRRGMDVGDTIVRRRLAQKMKLALDAGIEVPAPDDATLAAWVDERPLRYGEPARIAFDHVFVSRRRDTDEQARVARALVDDPEAFPALGDPHPAGAVVDTSTHSLERDFGPAFVEMVASLPAGQWQGPLRSSLGNHWVRVRHRQEAPPIALEAVRDTATRDWLQAQREALLRERLQALTGRYLVETNGARP